MSSVTATIRQGFLLGKVVPTHNGKTYYSFQGIPYAKPPVGPLRFKPPQPAEPWDGVRDATKEGNVAPQINVMTQKYEGNEDCLFLNIYIPQMSIEGGDGLKPVMVWIHGGGLTMGSGNSDLYGPDYLLDHGVIVVTFNYRLGVLGWMSTGDSVVPGNMGLKDQVMALRWVQENITVFGGDADNVTIFGESTGSLSCHLLVLSPMAKGLFQRAICQSMVAFRGILSAPVPERTFRLAHHLGLREGASSEELLAFMRDVPARKLVEEMLHSRSTQDKLVQDMYPFRPTLEPADAEGGAVLTEDPMEIIIRGCFNPVSIIFGVVSQEGFAYAKEVLGNSRVWRDLNSNFEMLLPPSLAADDIEKRSLADAIRKFYFGTQELDDNTFLQYAQMKGDILFVYPALQVAKLHASFPNSGPIYFYLFDVDASLNIYKTLYGVGKYKGAAHADDIPYLFRIRLARPRGSDTVEGRVIARMTKLWTNFARTGNPTPADDAILPVSWPKVNVGNSRYLEITNAGLTVKENLFKERMDFWDGMHDRK